MTGLSIDGVSHAFDANEVVREVSLAVTSGQVVCLLGPSGCGKTTLLRLAAGLETLQRGRIAIGGELVADAGRGLSIPPERRRVGLMFQDYALFPHLTVFENIAFGLTGRGRDRNRWIARALERVGLDDVANVYPHTLSGGQQQRCALLRALAPSPQVLLLDEPFSGLDVTRRAQVRERTLDLLREAGIATLMVTHDPEEAMFMGDRLAVMEEGRILQHGSAAEIYLHPADAHVATLFGALNRIDGVVRGGVVETPIGRFEADGLDEGAGAQVLIRPEGLQVYASAAGGATAPINGSEARVLSARLLGRSSHLRLAVAGIEQPLEALVPGVFLPGDGSAVRASAVPHQTFVFAAE